MKLVVGLGNPGKRYERTRHNLGFWVVDRLAAEKETAFKKKRHHSLIADWRMDGEEVWLVKPQTYMNHSGAAVSELLRHLPVETKDLVVIHDDLDLPFGRIRVRCRGGAAGHRGVLSILESLGEEAFCRLRIGIGRPPAGLDPVEFVLEPFSVAERSELDRIISRAAAAVECILTEGPHRAMEKFNRPEA